MRAEFFVVELKAQQDKESRKMTLGDNIGAGRRCCCISGYTALSFPFHFLAYGIHSWPYAFSVSTCANFDLQRAFRNVANVSETKNSKVKGIDNETPTRGYDIWPSVFPAT
jgi:hypothetical protein